MAKIHGTYEYDDDDLTPGNKKEGGLHQNLFDEDGNLKGSARFIPDDVQPGDLNGFEYVDPYYEAQLAAEAEAEERRLERERQENAELVAKVLTLLAAVAYAKAKPHAQRIWREKVGPAIQAKRDARAARKALRHERRKNKRGTNAASTKKLQALEETEVIEGTVVEPAQGLEIATREYRRNMSSSEAQARYLMALAAKAFSEEQLRLLANADIVDDEEFGELQRALAALPLAQVGRIIEQLELNPTLLADGGFDLAKFLENAPEKQAVEDRHNS